MHLLLIILLARENNSFSFFAVAVSTQTILLSSCSNLFIIIKHTEGKITMEQNANCEKIFSGVEQNNQKKNTFTHQIVYSCGLY